MPADRLDPDIVTVFFDEAIMSWTGGRVSVLVKGVPAANRDLRVARCLQER
jgi:hypothetical protein